MVLPASARPPAPRRGQATAVRAPPSSDVVAQRVQLGGDREVDVLAVRREPSGERPEVASIGSFIGSPFPCDGRVSDTAYVQNQISRHFTEWTFVTLPFGKSAQCRRKRSVWQAHPGK